MSTIIFNESLRKYSADYGKRFAVSNQQVETLADFVRRVRVLVKDFSLSEVERNSGGGIDGSYVSRIENGLVKNVTPEKLSALAKGLQVDEDDLFAVARGKSIEPMSPQDFYTALKAMGVEDFHAFGGVENLTADDQQEIIAMVSTLVEQKLKRKQASKGKGKK